MRQFRRLCVHRKLLIVIVAFWLATAGYAVHQYIASSLYGQQDQEQHQQQELLLPRSAKAARPSEHKPPHWPTIARGVELSRGMLDSSSYIAMLRTASSRRGDYFDARINATEMKMLVKLMWLVDEFCKQNDLVYFMYAATLTGSHRHHGIIPWDDDLDIMIPMTQRNRFIYLLRTKAQHLRMYTWSYHWKIWSPSISTTIVRNNYGWPFLDVFFYAENETHIYDAEPYYTATCTYEKNIVFPLHYRPFMGRWLPAPRDTSQFLVCTVKDPDGCHSPYYLHKEEKAPKKALSTRCDMLRDRYPFALKSLPPDGTGEGIIETLFLGDTPLHCVLVQEPSTSITFNYSLRLINSDGVRYAEPYS